MTYDVSSVLRSTPVSNMVLYAYDAESGKQLWSSGKTLPTGCISANRSWRWARCLSSPMTPMSWRSA